jgi:hypothetical protein
VVVEPVEIIVLALMSVPVRTFAVLTTISAFTGGALENVMASVVVDTV